MLLDNSREIDMLFEHSREVAIAGRKLASDKEKRFSELRKLPATSLIQAMGMLQSATPQSLDALVARMAEPKHELVAYLADRPKVNIQSKYPEYFCGHAIIKDHVVKGLVAFSANYEGCPYIWEVGSNDDEMIVNSDVISRFDVIEVIVDPVSVIKKYRVVIIAYGQPTFDITFPDIDKAVKIFVDHLYITEGLEVEL